MAKQKPTQQNEFNCKVCNEKITVLGVDCCTLRIKELNEYELPSELSYCENVKCCDFFNEKKYFSKNQTN